MQSPTPRPDSTLSPRPLCRRLQVPNGRVTHADIVSARMWSGALACLVLAHCLALAYGSNWTDYSTSLASNQQVILDSHNEARRNVVPNATNMLKMEWSEAAVAVVQEYLENCIYSHRSEDQLVLNEIPCIENIVFTKEPRPWDRIIQTWTNEVNNPGFVYGKGPRRPGVVGHYTQIVWYSSYLVGCAVNYCPGKTIYNYIYICQYSPGGNLKSRLMQPYDQGPSCQACPDDCENRLCRNSCPYVDYFLNCWIMNMLIGCETVYWKNFMIQHCAATCQCEGKIF